MPWSLKTKDFEQVINNYEETIKQIINPSEWHKLLTEEQNNLKNLAEIVFNTVKPVFVKYIGICLGFNKGYELGHPGIEDGLCFTKRILNKQSTESMNNSDKNIIEKLIEDTFFLGFVSHLLLYNFPTRNFIDNVNLNILAEKWSIETLRADQIMMNFDKTYVDWLKALFNKHYNTNVQPFLKNQMKIGFWKMGKCDSYFNNLFYAGSLLGLMSDLETKK
jgi:hypothetical protein